MTAAQMAWNLKRGFAWWELNSKGEPCDEWKQVIWTKAGGWFWDNSEAQIYRLEIV